jgi:hypothetical protein
VGEEGFMLLDTAVRTELARNFGGVLVVILTVELTMTLVRTIGLAASGAVAPQDVAMLLGYTALIAAAHHAVAVVVHCRGVCSSASCMRA